MIVINVFPCSENSCTVENDNRKSPFPLAFVKPGRVNTPSSHGPLSTNKMKLNIDSRVFKQATVGNNNKPTREAFVFGKSKILGKIPLQ